MRDLYHLTGIPIPETPAYRIAGQLDPEWDAAATSVASQEGLALWTNRQRPTRETGSAVTALST